MHAVVYEFSRSVRMQLFVADTFMNAEPQLIVRNLNHNHAVAYVLLEPSEVQPVCERGGERML